MKIMPISVIVPDFCPYNCDCLEIDMQLLRSGSDMIHKEYTCRNKELCENIYKNIIENKRSPLPPWMRGDLIEVFKRKNDDLK